MILQLILQRIFQMNDDRKCVFCDKRLQKNVDDNRIILYCTSECLQIIFTNSKNLFILDKVYCKLKKSKIDLAKEQNKRSNIPIRYSNDHCYIIIFNQNEEIYSVNLNIYETKINYKLNLDKIKTLDELFDYLNHCKNDADKSLMFS